MFPTGAVISHSRNTVIVWKWELKHHNSTFAETAIQDNDVKLMTYQVEYFLCWGFNAGPKYHEDLQATCFKLNNAEDFVQCVFERFYDYPTWHFNNWPLYSSHICLKCVQVIHLLKYTAMISRYFSFQSLPKYKYNVQNPAYWEGITY